MVVYSFNIMATSAHYLIIGRVRRVTTELSRHCRTLLFVCTERWTYDAVTRQLGQQLDTLPLVFVRDTDLLGSSSPLYVQEFVARDLQKPMRLYGKEAAMQTKKVNDTSAPMLEITQYLNAKSAKCPPIVNRSILNSLVTQREMATSIGRAIGERHLTSMYCISALLANAKVDVENTQCIYRTLADNYMPAGMAQMAVHVRPSSLVACSMPELRFLNALICGGMSETLAEHEIVLISPLMLGSPIRTDPQAAGGIPPSPAMTVLMRFYAMLKRSRSTCGRFAWEPEHHPFIDSLLQCGNILHCIDAEAGVYTTGRDHHNESQCASQLAIRTQVKLLAWRGDSEPMFAELRSQLARFGHDQTDVLFVVPTPSHALIAGRFGVPASCIVDVCTGRFWDRPSSTTVWLLWAHRFGAESFAGVLAALPRHTTVVCVGDPYPSCGAAQPYDRGSPFRDCWKTWRGTNLADRCEEFFFPVGATVRCGPLDANGHVDLLRREPVLDEDVYCLCTSLDEVPASVQRASPRIVASSEYWAWKLAGQAASDRHRVQNWLSFDDIGELRGVDRLYTMVDFPASNERVCAKKHLIFADRGVSLHTRFLYVQLAASGKSGEAGIDHRDCCGTDDANLCSIEVHLAHVRPADVMSAQQASHCSAGHVADELVLQMPPDDAYDGPVATVDDVHAALRLCRKRLWILCPPGSQCDAVLAAALSKRSRRPYTNLGAILQQDYVGYSQEPVDCVDSHPAPDQAAYGWQYYSLGLSDYETRGELAIGRSDGQTLTSAGEFMDSLQTFMGRSVDEPDEWGGACALGDGPISPMRPPAMPSDDRYPMLFHRMARRALDAMTVHEMDAHIDGRFQALCGGPIEHYPPSNAHLNRISGVIAGIGISLAERESVAIAALCMAVRGLGDGAVQWLLKAEAELFHRRLAAMRGTLSEAAIRRAYAGNGALQAALGASSADLGNVTVLGALCSEVHCGRIGAFIGWLPEQREADPDDDVPFLTKIANVRVLIAGRQ